MNSGNTAIKSFQRCELFSIDNDVEMDHLGLNDIIAPKSSRQGMVYLLAGYIWVLEYSNLTLVWSSAYMELRYRIDAYKQLNVSLNLWR